MTDELSGNRRVEIPASVDVRRPVLNDTAVRPRLDQLSGLVERVTFHNGESGFCVLRLKVKGEAVLVTLIGQAP